MTLCVCLAGAGLSSSSAFVCVAALALLAAFDAAHQSKTVRAPWHFPVLIVFDSTHPTFLMQHTHAGHVSGQSRMNLLVSSALLCCVCSACQHPCYFPSAAFSCWAWWRPVTHKDVHKSICLVMVCCTRSDCCNHAAPFCSVCWFRLVRPETQVCDFGHVCCPQLDCQYPCYCPSAEYACLT